MTVIYAAKLAQRDRDRLDQAVGCAASRGFRVRHEAADLGRWFVLTKAFVDHLTKQVVQVRYLTSTTSSGSTQSTRLRTRGEPKRFVRGGATSSGIWEVARGCSSRHSRPSSAWFNSSSDTPSVD
jgi:hypothetical protein